mmetsp:Transcript_11458/g.11350  ORF Transcript_11458/g.11350 Transcript_11458/m.11350 type:complete len:96 (-) Transcript_11458:35-322(-)
MAIHLRTHSSWNRWPHLSTVTTSSVVYDERHTEQQQHEEEERSSCGIILQTPSVRLLASSGVMHAGVASTEAVNQCLNDILDDELSRRMPALLLS